MSTWEAAFYRGMASNLWRILQDRGWSTRDLAERIGVHPRTVRRWLEGKSRMRDSYVNMRIVKATGCRYEDLCPSVHYQDRKEWVIRLSGQGLGVVDIARHVGLDSELVHLLLERHGLEASALSE